MAKATKVKGFLLVAITFGIFSLSDIANAAVVVDPLGQTQTQSDAMVFKQPMDLSMQGASKMKYDDAFAVLDIVNSKRKSAGLKPIVMDESLLQTAYVRAKEISQSFSHMRPNGERCFTADNKGGMLGENIASGYPSASRVMSAWMQSAGHKRNILNGDFKSIGIGCYYKNGTYYWVQCFSSQKGVEVSSVEQAKQLCGDVAAVSKDGQSDLTISNAQLKSGKKSLVLSWTKVKNSNGYQIQISKSKSFSKSKRSSYTIAATKKSCSIKKIKGKRLQSKKKYYVRIRAYQVDSTGTKLYGKWKDLNGKTK